MIGKIKIPLLDFKQLGKVNYADIKSQVLIPDKKFLSKSELHHLFHINRIKEYRNRKFRPVPPHRKTVHDCIFLTKGYAIRSKGIDQYTFRENQFFFQPALQISSHEFLSEDAEGFYMHFSPEIFHTLAFNYLKNIPFLDFLGHPIITIPQEMSKPIMQIFERMETVYSDFSKSDLDLISWYIMALMTEIKSFVVPEKSEKHNHAAYVVKQYKNALTQHVHEKQTVKDYADLLNITPNHLNKCVKTTLQITAQELLKEMIIVEAKFFLRYSDLSISEIAYELCDQSAGNFTRFFKSQTGLTPKEFINQYNYD